MSVTKELIEQERQQVQAGHKRDIHLHREGSFLESQRGTRSTSGRLTLQEPVALHPFTRR